MQLEGGRGIRSSKNVSSRNSSTRQARHSDRDKSGRLLDARRHLGYGAGDDEDEGPDYPVHSIDHEEQVEHELPEESQKIPNEVPGLSHGSAAWQGWPYTSTEVRADPGFQSPGPYQSSQYQPPPHETSPFQTPMGYSYQSSPSYYPAAGFPPNVPIPNTSIPNSSVLNTTHPPYGTKSYAPLPLSQQSRELDFPSGFVQRQSPMTYDLGIPSAQSQSYRKSIARNPSALADSAQDEDLEESQDEAGYMSIANPGGYFRPGRVFKTRTNLPESKNRSEAEQTLVVLQEGQGGVICAPLQTFDKEISAYSRGENLAMAFATGDKPEVLPGEDPSRMDQFPIFLEESSDSIDPKSRIDFSKPLTIEPSTRVRNVGRVDRNAVKKLKLTFQKATGMQPNSDTQHRLIGHNKTANKYSSKSSESRIPVPSDLETAVQERLSASTYSDLDGEEGEATYGVSGSPVFENTSTISHQQSTYRNAASPEYNSESRTRDTQWNPIEEPISQCLSGSKATRMISSSKMSGDSDSLFPDFTVHPSKHFQKGSVFKLLWSEPFGQTYNGSSGTEELEQRSAMYGVTAYHSVRRFVVVKERKGHSLCVPILTYRGQGTTKPGVKAEYHAIIYTGDTAPNPLPGEELRCRPIRLEGFTPSTRLASESRVNYGKVYTIEHNVKVHFIGKIHHNSMVRFFADFKAIDSYE